MKLNFYIQGRDTDKELFGTIGGLLVSKDVHDELGTPITTKDNDIWITATNKYGDCKGFLTYRKLKNSIHIRFVYGLDNMAIKELIKVALSRIEPTKMIFTNDRKTSSVWKEFDFKSKPRAKGNFCRWERGV